MNGTPWSLGVRCDRPGFAAVFESDFLVAEDSTRDDRLRVVLNHVANVGWRVEYPQGDTYADEAVTYCPSCAKAAPLGAGAEDIREVSPDLWTSGPSLVELDAYGTDPREDRPAETA